MSPPYLEQCLNDHKSLTKKKFGKEYDLYKIEKLVEDVKFNGLTFEDFHKIRTNDYWDYEKFWPIPDEESVRLRLKSVSGQFAFRGLEDKDQKKNLVAKLYDVFKNIEIVSTVLRFVTPSYFGIYSPPVALILDVRRGQTDVETYMNYIGNLQEVRGHYSEFRNRTIAQVDMALWALNEHINGNHPSDQIRGEFQKDPFMRKLKLKNLAAFISISDIHLAESLIETDMKDGLVKSLLFRFYTIT